MFRALKEKRDFIYGLWYTDWVAGMRVGTIVVLESDPSINGFLNQTHLLIETDIRIQTWFTTGRNHCVMGESGTHVQPYLAPTLAEKCTCLEEHVSPKSAPIGPVQAIQ